jgi:hypothetical protein
VEDFMTETVLGAIPDARIKTGMLSSETWVLVMTDQRLIGARLSGELRKHIIEQARAEAKAQGAGFFGQWGAQLKASFGISKRYLAMTPEAILAETPGNWALYPGQVSEIKVEHKTRTSGADDDIETDYLRITIATPAGKGTYETGDANPSREEVRNTLARTFGPVVR